jgi:hypothetical protein
MKQVSCDTGRKPYKTKGEVKKATGSDGERCHRCRWWHSKDDHPRRRR